MRPIFPETRLNYYFLYSLIQPVVPVYQKNKHSSKWGSMVPSCRQRTRVVPGKASTVQRGIL